MRLANTFWRGTHDYCAAWTLSNGTIRMTIGMKKSTSFLKGGHANETPRRERWRGVAARLTFNVQSTWLLLAALRSPWPSALLRHAAAAARQSLSGRDTLAPAIITACPLKSHCVRPGGPSL